MRPGGGQLTRVAAVDCGTNSIRLLIADVNRDGIPANSHCTTPTSLSEGVHTWYVTATDAVGNTATSLQTWTVTYDFSAPTAFGRLTPPDGTMIASDTRLLADAASWQYQLEARPEAGSRLRISLYRLPDVDEAYRELEVVVGQAASNVSASDK